MARATPKEAAHHAEKRNPHITPPPLIDKAQRDSSIDDWLSRRRGGPPNHAPLSGGGGSEVQLSSLSAVPLKETISMGSSLPPGRVPRRSGTSLNAKVSELLVETSTRRRMR